jgi:hypothetical protein
LTRPTYQKLVKDAVRMLEVRELNNFGKWLLVMLRIDLKNVCCRMNVIAPLFCYGTKVTNLTLESVFDCYVETRMWLHQSEFFLKHSTREVPFFFFNNQTDAIINQIYSVIKLYMFRASSLPIIRGSLLYIRHWYVSCRFDDGFQAELGWNILTMLGNGHHKPSCCWLLKRNLLRCTVT